MRVLRQHVFLHLKAHLSILRNQEKSDANDLGAVWNSLYEDFETYYERHPTACLLIGDQPHANIDHLRKNLASLLKQEAV